MRRMCIVFLLTVFIVLNGQENKSPGSEIGDAVFRPKFWNVSSLNAGHAALYYCSQDFGDMPNDSPPVYFDWDPQTSMIYSSNFLHSVIQATGKDDRVGYRSFATFLSGYTQWGQGYTKSGGLTPDERRRVIKYAREQYGARYPWPPTLNKETNQWYFPKIMTPNSSPFSADGWFRCDALVEYVYMRIGSSFFNTLELFECWLIDRHGEFQDIVFYPRALMWRMSPEVPTPPEVEVVSPEEGEDIEDNIHIEITADDGGDPLPPFFGQVQV